MISTRLRIVIFCLGVTISAWVQPLFSAQNDIVDLQLRWHHQFQFAGYYAALEKGFYKQEGIDVRLHQGDPQHQPVSEVLSGRAQYAEGNSEVLYQRLLGEPLIALAVIFQHSPSVLLTLKNADIHSVHDLIGKKVMLTNKVEDADFLTMFLNEGISYSQLKIIPSSYKLDDLITGKVDAFNSYSTNEPFFLKKHGIPYNVINPMTYSVDFYSDILFTSEKELRDHPKRVEAMRRATLKGWQYAMDNPEEIIDLLLTKYQVEKTREHLRFEAAEMRKLILPDLVQIGQMNPARWQHMANTFIKVGLVEDDDHLDGFIYDNTPNHLPNWVLPTFIVALLLIIIAYSISYYLHRFNLRMRYAQDTLQESEERFKALSEASYGGIIIHEKGVILECNSSLTRMTGFSHSELIGMNGLELIAPEALETVLENIRSGYIHTYESIGVRKDGSKYPLDIKGKNITYKGRDARVIEFVDITERKKIEEQLKLAASVFTHAREAIMITDNEANIIDVNETFSHITGYKREEVIGKNPRFLQSSKQSQEFYTEMWASLIEKKQWIGELWNKRKNGELFFQLATISAVTDSNGNIQNYVALFSDITQMKQHQQQLEHIAHFDSLTHLANRVLLADRLHQAMIQCQRRGQSLAVAYLDLDGFKAVNDAHGHDVGDELLITLSQRMNDVLRDGDTLARIGGDEFVAVLVDLDDMNECKLILDRLLEAAASPIITEDNIPLQVSTSIGVTLYPQDGADAEQLMRHADQAMYAAKQKGKNRYYLFDVHKDKSIQSQRKNMADIQRALDKNEFVLYYQPKVNMKTGEIIGVEALIRWLHPEHGLMLPGDFLPIIEGQPISVKLGEWVIDNALKQIAKWLSIGLDIPISVNIDALQLQQLDFVSKLSDALAKYPMVPHRSLELEILETSALADIEKVSGIMKACINIGVSFSLDDFGTGFSSLTYLKNLPAKLLKIDQSFVRDMLDDPDDRAIVMGVIGLASAFNRQVTAEGVESIAHGKQLLSMGCYLAQGYGIARPMPAQDIPQWVAEWKPDLAWLE